MYSKVPLISISSASSSDSDDCSCSDAAGTVVSAGSDEAASTASGASETGSDTFSPARSTTSAEADSGTCDDVSPALSIAFCIIAAIPDAGAALGWETGSG